jgi:hypothetical protein
MLSLRQDELHVRETSSGIPILEGLKFETLLNPQSYELRRED